MMKEMRMTIDTETIGGCTTPNGAYHYGATVHNLDGNITAVANILVMEHFDKIRDDDYAKKNFHLYQEMIASGTVTCVATEGEAVEVLRQLARMYNVKYIQAYNSGFDFVKTECSALLDEFQFVDLYLMALQTITHQKKYAKFCNEHGLYSKSGNTCATSVEAVYAFITNNPYFEEEHTAFEDALVETAIFVHLRKMHKKYTKNMHQYDCKVGKCFPKRETL